MHLACGGTWQVSLEGALLSWLEPSSRFPARGGRHGGSQGLFLLLSLLQGKGSGPAQPSPGSPLKSLSVSSAHLLPRLLGSM